MDINAPIGVFDSGVGGLTVVREDPYASCPMKMLSISGIRRVSLMAANPGNYY